MCRDNDDKVQYFKFTCNKYCLKVIVYSRFIHSNVTRSRCFPLYTVLEDESNSSDTDSAVESIDNKTDVEKTSNTSALKCHNKRRVRRTRHIGNLRKMNSKYHQFQALQCQQQVQWIRVPRPTSRHRKQ